MTNKIFPVTNPFLDTPVPPRWQR